MQSRCHGHVGPAVTRCTVNHDFLLWGVGGLLLHASLQSDLCPVSSHGTETSQVKPGYRRIFACICIVQHGDVMEKGIHF